MSDDRLFGTTPSLPTTTVLEEQKRPIANRCNGFQRSEAAPVRRSLAEPLSPFEPEFVRCVSASAVRQSHATDSSDWSSLHLDPVLQSVRPP
jgi:hypothetical protein